MSNQYSFMQNQSSFDFPMTPLTQIGISIIFLSLIVFSYLVILLFKKIQNKQKVRKGNSSFPVSPVLIPSTVEYLEFKLGKEFFPTYLTDGDLETLIDVLQRHPRTRDFDKILIGYHENTSESCLPLITRIFDERNINYMACAIPQGEENKSLESLEKVFNCFFKELNGTRKTIILALGGGVVSNLFGLAASTIFRGIRLVQMPTTFLNAHDAGGSSQKQAINYAMRKNVIGTFHMPSLVLTASSFYKTLPDKEIKSGFGELTKNAIAFGGAHLKLIEDTTFRFSPNELRNNTALMMRATLLGIKAKQDLLENDPREKYHAIVFEFGHTVGHGFELVMANTTHGECVAIGCDVASYISMRMGLLSSNEYEVIQGIVSALRPDFEYPDTSRDLKVIGEMVYAAVKCDNKRGYLRELNGYSPMILIRDIGKLHEPNEHFLEFVSDDLVREGILMGLQKYLKL